MKYFLVTYFIFSLVLSCKAQSITPLYPVTSNQTNETITNRYYKDVDNDYNPYVGIWKWESGNNSLTIIFNKFEHYPSGSGDYFDFLLGEYKYTENSVELVNTFPLIEPIGVPNIVNQEDPLNNNISSIVITTIDRGFPPCPECAPNTRFIILSISDPTKPGLWGEIKMARFVEGGVEKIRAKINMKFNENASIDYSGPDNITIPDGVYTFIKQN
ncbi:DUF6705 family protein [Xanthomarina spongicola]|uniref:DUF6705 domain-containing protein n=1 Tax=Xanthomarina spongicola TaxID=570520 RepID=A0A316ED53_9FLAO|nr:DUF6705 family protein [Xanthomarina spongicola]PWK20850.1 hypothetical protein LX78_00556 [Xanthomarina spongicola]